MVGRTAPLLVVFEARLKLFNLVELDLRLASCDTALSRGDSVGGALGPAKAAPCRAGSDSRLDAFET